MPIEPRKLQLLLEREGLRPKRTSPVAAPAPPAAAPSPERSGPFYASVIFQKLSEQDRKLLERITHRRGAFALRTLYEEEQHRVLRTFSNSKKTKDSRETLGVLRRAELFDRLSAELSEVAVEAQRESLHAFQENLTQLSAAIQKTEIPHTLDEYTSFLGLAGRRAGELGSRRSHLLRALTERLMLSLRPQEIRHSGISPEAILEKEWRAFYRILETEISYAFNSIRMEAAHEIPGLQLRWTERIVDHSGEPFDEKVSEDSRQMHGQIASPGAPFVLPSDPQRTVLFPPFRPRDRAFLMPYLPEWGVPGWTWREGRRVAANYVTL